VRGAASGRARAAWVAGAAAALIAGCASKGPPPPSGPRIDRDDVAYLVAPSTGFPATASPDLLRKVDAAFESKLLQGDLTAAVGIADAVLAVDPELAPAEVLRGQARLVARDLAAARATLDDVIRRYPDYTAAALAAAHAADLDADPAAAYALFRRFTRASPAALDRAGELHQAAVSAVAAQVEDAVGKGRLDEARQSLATLEEWAPGEQATLEAALGLARAAGDKAAELSAVRGLLASARSGDEVLFERRGELELEAGQPSAAIEIFQELQRRHPNEPRHADQVSLAKFRWRVQNLPTDVRRLVDTPELTRAEFAVLVYWLVPGVRAAVVSSPHIASDILDHPHRQEMMRVANLQLLDLDETLRRFNPDWAVRRSQALKALERVLQRAQPAPTCVAGLAGNPSPSREAVCGVAVACGLLPETADCLPEGGLSGADAAAWIRRTGELLP